MYDSPDPWLLEQRRRVGRRIRLIREWRSLSQMALAHQMGLSLATIWRWENAERPASVDGLHLLAWALDVPPALLLGDDWSPLPDLDAWEQREVARRRRSQA